VLALAGGCGAVDGTTNETGGSALDPAVDHETRQMPASIKKVILARNHSRRGYGTLPAARFMVLQFSRRRGMPPTLRALSKVQLIRLTENSETVRLTIPGMVREVLELTAGDYLLWSYDVETQQLTATKATAADRSRTKGRHPKK
jgi:hypothetical protein